ncbi:putative phosphatase-domain-containing protein [Phlyctochytrium arcticum]|nr:putative phosphatase-domain-containing protein [Phlyctochytrium arcticum]
MSPSAQVTAVDPYDHPLAREDVKEQDRQSSIMDGTKRPSEGSDSSNTKKPRVLLAFDFDWTLVDEDSDRFVFSSLAPELLAKLYNQQGKTQWTDLMAELHRDLHAQGITSDEALKALDNIPFDEAVGEMLRDAKRRGCDLAVFSDANEVAIKRILQAHQRELYPLFTTIITNPAHVTPAKLLSISRRTAPPAPPHNCPNGCAVNLCKGSELLDLLAAREPYDVVVYAGDGRNDLCPALKLRKQDKVLPRLKHMLASILSPANSAEDISDPTGTLGTSQTVDPVAKVPKHAKRAVDAEVRGWASGGDLKAVIEDILSEVGL